MYINLSFPGANKLVSDLYVDIRFKNLSTKSVYNSKK